MLIQRLALITALLAGGLASVFADDIPVDPNLVVIISDVHVGANPNKPDYAAVPEVKLQRVIDKILAMNPRPALVLNYGDISYNDGNKIDYEMVKPILSRLDEAGIPWVTTFGNHDLREVFWSVFPEKRGVEEFPERLVTVTETDRAFFILLDSLEVGNVSTHPDPAQLKWLDEKLTSLEPTGKRVYVGAHHLIEEFGVAETLKKHPNAAGYIFGHAHHWLCRPIDGIPCIGLSSTGYTFPGDTQLPGYATLRLGQTEDVFTLHSQPGDPQDGETFTVQVK